MIAIGDDLPQVSLDMGKAGEKALPDFRGTPLIVYFYPKDDTSGCTREAIDFTAAMPHFDAMGVAVIGVSKDDAKKHRRFAEKHALTVPLATDAEGVAMEAFGVWVEKSMYGRKYMGVERSTFLFDGQGKLAQAWRKVRVPGHVDAVLASARSLTAA